MSASRQKARRRAAKNEAQTATLKPEYPTAISTSQFYLLKWIACITMVIDHVAIFFRHQCSIPYEVFINMRYVGRTAFPIFAYLLVESFFHTKNRKRHLFRIGLLALISELPYDVLNAYDKTISLEHQNVCLDLFLGFLMMMLLSIDFKKLREAYHNGKFARIAEGCIKINIAGAFIGLGYLLNCDFKQSGVLLIAILYLARNNKYKHLLQALGFLAFGVSMGHLAYMFVIVPLILIYMMENVAKKSKDKPVKSGLPQRFLQSKFSRKLTGVFYPLHLIILIIIRAVMVLNA